MMIAETTYDPGAWITLLHFVSRTVLLIYNALEKHCRLA
jgi:hypothetical protein